MHSNWRAYQRPCEMHWLTDAQRHAFSQLLSNTSILWYHSHTYSAYSLYTTKHTLTLHENVLTCTRNTSSASTGLYTPAAVAMKGLALALDSVLATNTPTSACIQRGCVCRWQPIGVGDGHQQTEPPAPHRTAPHHNTEFGWMIAETRTQCLRSLAQCLTWMPSSVAPSPSKLMAAPRVTKSTTCTPSINVVRRTQVIN